LTHGRVAKVVDVLNRLEKEGLSISKTGEKLANIPVSIDIKGIFETVFSDRMRCFEKIESFIENGDYNRMDSLLESLDELKEISEKYDRERGLSLSDLKSIQQTLELFFGPDIR
jgi:hypothetical protein